jgi:hypothetical protein
VQAIPIGYVIQKIMPFIIAELGEHFQRNINKGIHPARMAIALDLVIIRITYGLFLKVVKNTTIIICKPFASNATQAKQVSKAAKSKK